MNVPLGCGTLVCDRDETQESSSWAFLLSSLCECPSLGCGKLVCDRDETQESSSWAGVEFPV